MRHVGHALAKSSVKGGLPAQAQLASFSTFQFPPCALSRLSEMCVMCMQAGDVKKTADYVAQVGLCSLLGMWLQIFEARVPAR